MPSALRSMEQIEQKLTESIDWNKARIKFLARFLAALIAVKTVCLTQIASVFPGEARKDSHYKRIQRFLSGFHLDFATVARLVIALIGQEPPWILALDRSNWKLGKTHINVLMLALVYKGVAFPLLWMVLGKAGNSSTAERIALLEQYLCLFPAPSIAYLCADREFVGKEWLDYLRQRGIPFRIRLRNNTQVPNARGVKVAVKRLFWSCPVGQSRTLAGSRCVWGRDLYLSGMRLARGEFLIVASADPSAETLTEYGKRWGIETLFGGLKRRGFCLEATHVTEPERLCRLLALLSIAFCWAFVAGEWLSEQVPLKVKKHGRPAVAILRRGLDWLRALLCPLCGRTDQRELQKALQFLSCT
ncbi:MAG TPA: IS4 family transposase [Chloroflexota bacterium]|nr:IS4 family transposase [Chloroflexota bacterium]